MKPVLFFKKNLILILFPVFLSAHVFAQPKNESVNYYEVATSDIHGNKNTQVEKHWCKHSMCLAYKESSDDGVFNVVADYRYNFPFIFGKSNFVPDPYQPGRMVNIVDSRFCSEFFTYTESNHRIFEYVFYCRDNVDGGGKFISPLTVTLVK
jgi:hypothetical protein